jgi:hypothetical protein
MKTPVAFIIFNRPDTTARVFEAIRQAKPPLLLVIADGARVSKSGEAEKCTATRAIIDGVDWECEVRTNYSDINLGCKRRVSSGLDWVFSEVEEAIILEDDCLPAPSFFSFCENLLEKYRHDLRVTMISGDCFWDSQNENNISYQFSKYGGIWGWASWRRAWQHYDVDMKTWPEYKQSGVVNSFFDSDGERNFWSKIFDVAYSSGIDTWDHQWVYSRWIQGGLDIAPSVNLVSNIGFRADGTHTTVNDNLLADMAVKDIWEIKHPATTIRNKALDNYIFNEIYNRRSSITDIAKKIISKVFS